MKTLALARLFRQFVIVILCAAAPWSSVTAAPAQMKTVQIGTDFIVLCYHDVSNAFAGDPNGVSIDTFVTHLNWLRDNGYQAISIDDVMAARAGTKPLPPRAFLLSFDDGYLSFYDDVFPILKTRKLPAVFGIVTAWIDGTEDAVGDQTDPFFRKQQFVTWAQLKEMRESGLVEIASHSHNLHHGIPSNPQGNTQPAGITLRYLEKQAQYEDEASLRLRLRNDIAEARARIEKNLGVRPRVMVWPFGAYNQIGIEEANREGMMINFSLDTGLADVNDLNGIDRVLVGKNMTLAQFSYAVNAVSGNRIPEALRGIRLTLDEIAGDGEDAENEKLGKLLERVKQLGVNTVFLDAHPKSVAGAQVSTAYFPSEVLTMKRDLFNRAAWQLRKRLGVEVFAVMGTSFTPVGSRDVSVTAYRDLARHAIFQGIVIDARDAAPDGNTDLRRWIRQVQYYRKPTTRLFDGVIGPGRLSEAMLRAAISNPDSAFVIGTDDDEPIISCKQNCNNLVVQIDAAARETDDVQLLERLRAFERAGMRHLIIDDGRGLLAASEKRVDWLRRAISVRANPF